MRIFLFFIALSVSASEVAVSKLKKVASIPSQLTYAKIDAQGKTATRLMIDDKGDLRFLADGSQVQELGFDAESKVYTRSNSAEKWIELDAGTAEVVREEILACLQQNVWDEATRDEILAVFKDSDIESTEELPTMEEFSVDSKTLSFETVQTEDPKGTEWVQIECTTQGCRWKNMKTGLVIRVVKKTVADPLRRIVKPFRQAFGIPPLVPRLVDIDPYSETFTVPGSALIADGSRYSPVLPSPTAEETALDFSKSIDIVTIADYERLKRQATAAGMDHFIFEIGNLGSGTLSSCAICVEIHNAIMSEIKPSFPNVAVADFNYNQHGRTSELIAAKFRRSGLSGAYFLPEAFSYPKIYVASKKGSDWVLSPRIDGDLLRVPGTIAAIRARIE